MFRHNYSFVLNRVCALMSVYCLMTSTMNADANVPRLIHCVLNVHDWTFSHVVEGFDGLEYPLDSNGRPNSPREMRQPRKHQDLDRLIHLLECIFEMKNQVYNERRSTLDFDDEKNEIRFTFEYWTFWSRPLLDHFCPHYDRDQRTQRHDERSFFHLKGRRDRE